MNNRQILTQVNDLLSQLKFKAGSDQVKVSEVDENFLADKVKKRIVKFRDAGNKDIKSRLLPNSKRMLGEYEVWVSESERTTLDAKKIKEDYKAIYDTYGKTSSVKTLNIKEVG